MFRVEDFDYTKLKEADFRDHAWSGAHYNQPRLNWEALYAALVPKDSFILVFQNGGLVSCSDPDSSIVQIDSQAEGAIKDAWMPDWLRICSDAALNQASLKWQIHIQANLQKPLYVFHFYTADKPKQALFSWQSYQVANGVELDLVEIVGDLSVAQQSSLCYGQSQICLGEKSQVRHQRVALCSPAMTAAFELAVRLQAGSQYSLANAKSGGKQHRTHLQLHLEAKAAEVVVKSLSWGNHQDKLDTHVWVCHEADQGQSLIEVRGIADKKATVSMTGKIRVSPKTQANRAELENKNLLLSKEASANTRPQLEIESDSLEACRHGATVGYLDEEALFYLRSRGIPFLEARSLLIDSFLSPVLSALAPSLQKAVSQQLLGYTNHKVALCPT